MEEGKTYRGGNAIAVALGVHPSALGNLNAWNSSDEAKDSEGMPGRLAEFEEFVRWSSSIEGSQGDVVEAAALFGDAPCNDVDASCSYDLAVLFPLGAPVEGDENYEDYLTALQANEALAFLAENEDTYEAYGQDAELEALQEIANKDITDDLFAAIREWVLSTEIEQSVTE